MDDSKILQLVELLAGYLRKTDRMLDRMAPYDEAAKKHDRRMSYRG